MSANTELSGWLLECMPAISADGAIESGWATHQDSGQETCPTRCALRSGRHPDRLKCSRVESPLISSRATSERGNDGG